LEHHYFRFQFSFVLFDAINGCTPTYFSWRRHTPFFIANTLVFTLIVQRVFSFSSTAFSFRFSPCFFCSELVISLKQGVFRPLVYGGFHLYELFQKG
jgi:hypothetical protein